MKVTVIVWKTFLYRGCDLRPGQLLELDPRDALRYQRDGLVGVIRSQTYRTRDLLAR